MKKLLMVILLAFVGVSILTIMFSFQTSNSFNFEDDDDDDDDDEVEVEMANFDADNFASDFDKRNESNLIKSKFLTLKYKNLIIWECFDLYNKMGLWISGRSFPWHGKGRGFNSR